MHPHRPLIGALIASLLALCAPLTPVYAQSERECRLIKERFDDESRLTRIAFYHLQTVRQGVVDLDAAWQNQHELNVGSAIIDVSFLAGSLLTKPLTAAFGVAIAKQTFRVAIIEACLTGIAKSSLKDFHKILLDNEVDPADALKAATGKAAEGGGKKVIEEFTKDYLTQKFMARVQSGELADLKKVTQGAGGVDTATRGAKDLEELAGQWAKVAVVFISLGTAVQSAWTNSGKLEYIEQARDALRNEEKSRTTAWQERKQYLEWARNALNRCNELYPGDRTSPPAPSGPVKYVRGTQLASKDLPGAKSQPTELGIVLQQGKSYFVVGSGNVSLWDGQEDGCDSVFRYKTPLEPKGGEIKVWGQLELFNPNVHLSELIQQQTGKPPVYDGRSHTYQAIVIGTGLPFKARVFDGGGYGDNHGHLTVSVYEAVPAR